MLIIDKCKGDREKALFYVRRTIQNGWSRSVLLNWLSTDLYEREDEKKSILAKMAQSGDIGRMDNTSLKSRHVR